MKEYSKDDLIRALKEVGLKKGDVVLVSTELFTLGRLKGATTSEEYHTAILDAIFDVIDKKEGTVVVHTYTTYCGRYGIPFDYNRSRSTTGAFSEYVLFHPESVRSLHPINSFAAIGKRKRDICLNVSASNYGLDSPVDRMFKLDCQILRLGIGYADNVFTHYVETLYGVPYLYNKLLDIDVIVDGLKIDKQFFASVRHLELSLEEDLSEIKKVLDKNQCVFLAKVDGGFIYRISAKRYCEILLSLLKKNPYCLLKRPPDFKKGQKPYDGKTEGKDGVTEEANFLFKDLYREDKV